MQWNLAWYNGGPFLRYYSPLYYQIASFFNNIIFGANFLQFISILLTAIGIFFLIDYYSENKTYSLIFSLFFLSVLSVSYYFISVGNSPFIFSIFTIPFTLLFLERSLDKKRYNFLIYSFFFVLAYLTHIFIAAVLFLLVTLRIVINFYFYKSKKKVIEFIKKGIVYLGMPMLISSFWFLPFLTKSKSFIGYEKGYVPTLKGLFGLDNFVLWGKSPGGIGILFGLFLISLFFVKKYFKEKNEKIIFLSISSILLFFLLEGILGEFYPTGVGAVRFVLPFSIIASIFSGAIFSKQFENNKKIISILAGLLIIALIFNYDTINENYEKYSYNSKYHRYGLIDSVYSSENFPLSNNFSNYRFGTSRYIFSETLNYKFPWQSQTWGYFDQQMLFPEKLNKFREIVWNSGDLNKTLDIFDRYGIKYFEIGGEDLKFDYKFTNSSKFSLIINKTFSDYPFKIYKYNEAKPIVSILLENNSYEEYSKYKVIRETPDKVIISYNFSGKEKILFKESFHKSWFAKNNKNKQLNLKKTEDGFIILIPPKNSNRVIIYQSRTGIQKLGMVVSFFGIILVLIYSLFLIETGVVSDE